jgi:hypothetical protein
MFLTLRLDGSISVPLLLILPPLAVYYAFLLTGGSFDVLEGESFGMTFNSMLAHLLRGEFNVDPIVIGHEGFVRDGKTYAYFGIFGALLRLPLLFSGGLWTVDMTTLSCLVAAVIIAGCKLAAVVMVYRAVPPSGLRALLLIALGSAALFSGPEITFLKASIYQEVVLWANACASAFVCCAVYGIFVRGSIGPELLVRMAILAGTCLLTRVSTATGLYAATGLLLARLYWSRFTGRGDWAWPTLLRPALYLAFFAALCAFINYQRWGNPLTFADLHLNIIYQTEYAERFVVLDRYGEFNPIRLGYGLMYYFFPLWVLRGADGTLLFDGFQRHIIDSVELPPSSFFISDPLLLGLAAVGLFLAWRRRSRPGIDLLDFGFVAGALAVPPLLILMAMSMTFRYRGEFYPLFEFLACAGYFFACSRPSPRLEPSTLTKAMILEGCALSIMAAHVLLLVYDLSAFGFASREMHGGSILEYYEGRLLGPGR